MADVFYSLDVILLIELLFFYAEEGESIVHIYIWDKLGFVSDCVLTLYLTKCLLRRGLGPSKHLYINSYFTFFNFYPQLNG